MTQQQRAVYGSGNVIGGPRDVDRNVIAGASIEVALTAARTKSSTTGSGPTLMAPPT